MPVKTNLSEFESSIIKPKRVINEIQESEWLNPLKTLREQNIFEMDRVLLKKKFYFSDGDVDKTDVFQLGILYAQAQKSIVQGLMPVNVEECVHFAALQMQILYENHEPDKHKKGIIGLNEFVPPEFIKKKDLEKKVYEHHKSLYGMSALNAKYKYLQLIRSMKLYGMTVFPVKVR